MNEWTRLGARSHRPVANLLHIYATVAAIGASTATNRRARWVCLVVVSSLLPPSPVFCTRYTGIFAWPDGRTTNKLRVLAKLTPPPAKTQVQQTALAPAEIKERLQQGPAAVGAGMVVAPWAASFPLAGPSAAVSAASLPTTCADTIVADLASEQ